MRSKSGRADLELPASGLIHASVADAHTQGSESTVGQLLHRSLHTRSQLIRVMGHVQQNLRGTLGHLHTPNTAQESHGSEREPIGILSSDSNSSQ